MKKDELNHVYAVGERGLEGESILHLCSTYSKAYAKWDEIRQALVEFFEGLYEVNALDKFRDSIENLKCREPENLSNFPHIEPFIDKREVI